MTPYQRLIPFFDSYNRKVTDARNDLRLSLAELSEQSGVSYSAIATQSADTAPNPKLFEQAAICDTLGLSLDELCGLCPRQTSPPCMSLKWIMSVRPETSSGLKR